MPRKRTDGDTQGGERQLMPTHNECESERQTVWIISAMLTLVLLGSCNSVEETGTAIPDEPTAIDPESITYQPLVSQSSLADWAPPSTWTGRASPERQPLPSKWIVLTWDGATWDVALPLIEAGRMPNFASLMRNGVYADIHTIRPTESPVLWTTVATGMRPDQHGILGWVRKVQRVRGDPSTRRRLYLNSDRRIKAIWNILSELEKEVLVVGFHNTFPTERVTGQMVSNFLVYRYASQNRLRRTPAMDEVYAQAVYPSAAAQEALRHDRSVDSLTFEEISRFADYTTEEFDRYMSEAATGERDKAFIVLRRAYLFDTINAEVALSLFEQAQPNLFVLHFQSLDWSAHKFLYHHAPEWFSDVGVDQEDVQELNAGIPTYGRTVAAFYEYADEWLGKFLQLADSDTGVMVLSDHGFRAEGPATVRRSGFHRTAPPGIFAVSGPGVREGARIENVTIYDVLPTLFALMGLEVANDWEGQPLLQVFESTSSRDAITYRDTYQSEDFSVPKADVPKELNEELLEQLRTLGYIQ